MRRNNDAAAAPSTSPTNHPMHKFDISRFLYQKVNQKFTFSEIPHPSHIYRWEAFICKCNVECFHLLTYVSLALIEAETIGLSVANRIGHQFYVNPAVMGCQASVTWKLMRWNFNIIQWQSKVNWTSIQCQSNEIHCQSDINPVLITISIVRLM